MANISGTIGWDSITGTNDDDNIRGTSGLWIAGAFVPTGTDTGYDTLIGLGGNDKLYGYGGNDILIGGAGVDEMYGGSGNDIFRYRNGQDGIDEIIDGGTDFDTITFYNNSTASNTIFDMERASFIGIDKLQFNSYGTLILYSNQLYQNLLTGKGLPFDLEVRGYNVAGHKERIEIFTNFLNPDVSLAGWSFSNWGGQGDEIIFYGDPSVNNFHGTQEADKIYGYGGADHLYAYAGDDLVEGGDGNDVLHGGKGVDILRGGAHNDTFRILGVQDLLSGEIIDGGANFDTIELNISSTNNPIYDLRPVTVRDIEKIEFATSGTLRLNASQIENPGTFSQPGLSPYLTVVGIVGPANNEYIEIYMGNDVNLNISGWTFSGWDLVSGGSSIFVYGDGSNETIITSSEDDTISGEGGNDVITSGNGHDIIEGGPGRDTMTAGSGNDIFVYSSVFDPAPNETVDGGLGTDRLVIRLDTTQYGKTLDMLGMDFTSIEKLIFESAGIVQIDASEINNGFSSTLEVAGDQSSSFETIRIEMGQAAQLDISGWTFRNWGTQFELIHINGSSKADYITGSIKNDVIIGGKDSDILIGGQGDDEIVGGGGLDSMTGGEGDDIFRYLDGEDAGTGENVIAGNGYDRLILQNSTANSDTTYDLLGGNFSSVEEIVFRNGATLRIDATAAQAGFSNNLNIRGKNSTGNTELLHVVMQGSTSLDLSGWTFQNWGAQGEEIHVFGDADTENITGSRQNDIFHTNAGADVVSAGLGNDVFRFDDGANTETGGVLDGGLGTDTIQLANDPNAADKVFDFRGVDFSSIEKLDFSSAGTVMLDSSEVIQGLSDTLFVVGALDLDTPQKIEIHIDVQNSLDLTQWQFTQWFDHKGDVIRVLGMNQEAGDKVVGTQFKDVVLGFGGNDVIYGNGGNDVIRGHDGVDQLYGGDGDDLIEGGEDEDYIEGGSGDDSIYGDKGRDEIYGGIGEDTIYGGGAIDDIYGEGGRDTIHGGNSDDTIYGGGEVDTIYGNTGNDTIYGGPGADVIDGGKHNDTIYGNDGTDILKGGAGRDTIDGGLHADIIHGNGERDILKGGGGGDTLYGGTGNDDLYGNVGNDTLHGDGGFDLMWGGGGVDTFVYEKKDLADRIKDF